jgi:predicted HNH restriction endonuclease
MAEIKVTTKKFADALQALNDRGIASSRRNLLVAHFDSPHHRTSMSQLAYAVGYPNYRSANLNYGLLAKAIARQIGISLRNRLNLSVISTWEGLERRSGEHFTFVMRAELAAALEQLGWTRNVRPANDPLEPLAFLEGKRRSVLRTHLLRDQRARSKKIAAALRASPDGRLRCEVPGCGFDFEAIYGELGVGFAHVHHKDPLHRQVAKTTLDRLAIVCPNCHEMIHRFGECRSLKGLIAR